MAKLRHVHYIPVAPAPLPPDLFEQCGRFGQFPMAEQPLTGLPGESQHDMMQRIRGISVPVQPVDTSLAAAARIKPHTARVREALAAGACTTVEYRHISAGTGAFTDQWHHAVAWATQSGECKACGAEICRGAKHDAGCPFREA